MKISLAREIATEELNLDYLKQLITQHRVKAEEAQKRENTLKEMMDDIKPKKKSKDPKEKKEATKRYNELKEDRERATRELTTNTTTTDRLKELYKEKSEKVKALKDKLAFIRNN